jgi:hypothetical protein
MFLDFFYFFPILFTMAWFMGMGIMAMLSNAMFVFVRVLLEIGIWGIWMGVFLLVLDKFPFY